MSALASAIVVVVVMVTGDGVIARSTVGKARGSGGESVASRRASRSASVAVGPSSVAVTRPSARTTTQRSRPERSTLRTVESRFWISGIFSPARPNRFVVGS